MITYTTGNLLDADVDALVNTVNTVGVMGKGIALMFKERFPENTRAYEAGCKSGQVRVGEMFVTHGTGLWGPRWIINFPTKQHWRQPTKLEWVKDGLESLRRIIIEQEIRSIAIPPLGCGNGGLHWDDVRPLIEQALQGLTDVQIIVYEPSHQYQNVAKSTGVETLTPARALVAEAIRRYSVIGIECTLVETQKLAWFLERSIVRLGLENPLNLRFNANRYGPYSLPLMKLLEALDGSYLHSEKRLADAAPFDCIWFDDSRRNVIDAYLMSQDNGEWIRVLDATDVLIDGFQSPLNMEALASVDWLHSQQNVDLTLESMRMAISQWPNDPAAAERKNRIFSDALLLAACDRIAKNNGGCHS